MSDILLREDTGSFAAVRPVDDTPPLLAALQKEREGSPMATWAEFNDGLAELRSRLVDGLGEADAVLAAGSDEPQPVVWAELPDVQPASVVPAEPDPGDALLDWWVNVDDDPGTMPGRVVRVGRTTLTPRDNPLAVAYAEREARGWTPNPADYGPRPVLEQGPRGGFWRRIDAVLERWDDWLRRKQAERDKRMGADQ